MPYKKILSLTAALIVTLFFHLWFKAVLPYPFHAVNIMCAAAIFALIVNPTFAWLWFVLIAATLENAFLSTALAVNLLPLIISFILLRWLTLNVFTNKSVTITAFLSCLFFLIYRMLFLLLSALNTYWFATWAINYNLIFNRCLLEMSLSSALVIIAHFIGKLFLKNLRPEFVAMKKNIYGF